MTDIAIRATATASVPRDYTIPGAQELLPKVISASLDGSAAATAYIPTLQILEPGGHVMFSAPAQTSYPAGASVDVNWFPGLGVGGTSASSVAVVGTRIEMHASQSINNATNTNLTYDTVAFDTAGMANLGADNRKLTVQVSGLYMVCIERAWQVNATNRRLVGLTQNSLYGSGGSLFADDARLAITGGGQTTNGLATIQQAVVGDFFASGANQDSGVALTSGGGSSEYFSAILLGTL